MQCSDYAVGNIDNLENSRELLIIAYLTVIV